VFDYYTARALLVAGGGDGLSTMDEFVALLHVSLRNQQCTHIRMIAFHVCVMCSCSRQRTISVTLKQLLLFVVRNCTVDDPAFRDALIRHTDK
jgi:hypothetical protein